MAKLKRFLSLPTAQELKEEYFANKSWDSFNHTTSQVLSLNSSHPTKRVTKQGTNQCHILQSCSQQAWTEACTRLLDIARTNKSFITPCFMFLHGGNVYVGSEVVAAGPLETDVGLTLADIIDSSLPLAEVHVVTVLKYVK